MTELLTVNEVANLLKLSPRTVYDHAGRLGGFRPVGIRAIYQGHIKTAEKESKLGWQTKEEIIESKDWVWTNVDTTLES